MVNPEEFFSKEAIQRAKDLGKEEREKSGIMSVMSEAELTEAQRESEEPIGTKGYFRMYRWECVVCSIHGRKMPYSEAIQEGYLHCREFNHEKNISSPPIMIRAGVFKKEELYKD